MGGLIFNKIKLTNFLQVVFGLQKIPARLARIMIYAYQYLISPVLGNHCRYYPSCSRYTGLAIERFGIMYGSYVGIKRIIRCHPWHPGGYDPVPSQTAKAVKPRAFFFKG